VDQAALAEKPSLTLNRKYGASPEAVWRAWTTPEALKQWWGPGGPQAVSVAELDLRVGGRFRICFGGPQGNDNECAGVYKEVVPNRRLQFSWHWPRTTPERVSLVTIDFRPVPATEGGGTELVFRHEQFFDQAAADGHKRGWTETLQKLESFLQS
jgi:uncharacterized protein YndB with AHSA1/START domain